MVVFTASIQPTAASAIQASSSGPARIAELPVTTGSSKTTAPGPVTPVPMTASHATALAIV